MRSLIRPLLLTAALSVLATSGALAADQVDRSVLATANPALHVPTAPAGTHIATKGTNGVLGVDSIVNFSSYFYAEAPQDPLYFGFSWPYTMVGHSPFQQGQDDQGFEGPTFIDAPVVPVTVTLLDQNGNVRQGPKGPLVQSANALVQSVLRSPVFSPAWYTSSNFPTQFTDAVLRASFYNLTNQGWHTFLAPRVLKPQNISVPYGFYAFALNADGTCCDFILVDYNTFGGLLFPPTATDMTTPMGIVENTGQISTQSITTFLFNNIYLYEGTLDQCCVLGYHSYDLEPGSAKNGWREKRYVMNYSSWISPGLFNGGLADVSALSHEMSETFYDPFVNNQTPIWLSPNGNCQNNLEVGDVIENLPNGLHTVTLNGYTYHPQNEALLQWFADTTPSNAIGGMYSYPDAVLTAPAQYVNANCQ